MNEDVKPENMRIHSRADELIACPEGEIAKRDARIAGLEQQVIGMRLDVITQVDAHAVTRAELAACRVAVENCEVFRARIAELESQYQRDVCGLNNEGDPIGGDPAGGYANDNARLRAELAALKAQEPVEYQLRALIRDVTNIPEAGYYMPQSWHDQVIALSLSGKLDAPVSEAKAQGVVQWPNADEIMQMAFEEGHPADDASGYYFELEEFDLFIERLMSEVARLNAAPVHQVSVPDVSSMARILADRNADACNVNREDNWAIYGRDYIDDVVAMLAAPAAPAADAGLVEARKANNELVNDLHVMTNKRRQLVDALTYLRECLDPEDYMGEISMHDFIDDALAANRVKGVV